MELADTFLYGRKCRTPLNWVEAGERRYYGIDFVTEAKEQVRTIQTHMAVAQARQKVMLIDVENLLSSKLETSFI